MQSVQLKLKAGQLGMSIQKAYFDKALLKHSSSVSA